MSKFEPIIEFIRKLYKTESFIPLHVPYFFGNEKKYLNECIDTGFVSSVGEFVNRFEEMMREYTGSKYAIAAVNGTAALHAALHLIGTGINDEVLTQPLTFVATANAIAYCKAEPVFIDVQKETLGLDPDKLAEYVKKNGERKRGGEVYNRKTGRRISACLPVHIFGHPNRIDDIVSVCESYGIPVIEDAAESLGTTYREKHTGTYGRMGVFSFNGNKTMTTGGGGIIVTDDDTLGKDAKYITTTAKRPHKWEYYHDMLGFNYRMPNINAALGCAQLEQLPGFLRDKRDIAREYADFFKTMDIELITEPENARSNYWLNAVILKDKDERDAFLEYTNTNKVMTRPVWRLMTELPMYRDCERGDLTTAKWLEERVVNIPSSIREKEFV